MKLSLFEYVVLLHPRDEKEEDTKIIVEATNVLAKDTKTVAMLVARKIPEKYLKVIDSCEVVVRPF